MGHFGFPVIHRLFKFFGYSPIILIFRLFSASRYFGFSGILNFREFIYFWASGYSSVILIFLLFQTSGFWSFWHSGKVKLLAIVVFRLSCSFRLFIKFCRIRISGYLLFWNSGYSSIILFSFQASSQLSVNFSFRLFWITTLFKIPVIQ